MAVQLFSRSPIARPAVSARILIGSILSRTVPAPSPLFSTSTAACAIRRSLLCSISTALSVSSSCHDGINSIRAFSTRATSSSLNDSNPNWSNRPPKETILLDGCDFEHWLVVMEKPEGDPTRDEIIDSYIKTLAMVVGSEEDARMKIYSVSTRCYFAFGALVSEELSYKLKELPRVRWVLPDSYLNVKEKDYGGEPFINGQAVPYDPKYHEEWERNNQRAMERNRRNDRPRNNDRSRSFNRNRNMQYQDVRSTQTPGMPNSQPNIPVPPQNQGGYAQNNAALPSQGVYSQNNTAPPNQGGYANNNNSVPPSQGGYSQNSTTPSSQGGYAQNMTVPPSQGGYVQNNRAPPSQGVYGQNNMVPPNQGGYPQGNMVPPTQGGYSQTNMMPPSQGRYPQNTMPPQYQGGYPNNQGGFSQGNMGPNPGYPPNNAGQPSFSPRMPENVQQPDGPLPNNYNMQQNNMRVPSNAGLQSGNAGWPSSTNAPRSSPQNFNNGPKPEASYPGVQQNYQDNFSPARDGTTNSPYSS